VSDAALARTLFHICIFDAWMETITGDWFSNFLQVKPIYDKHLMLLCLGKCMINCLSVGINCKEYLSSKKKRYLARIIHLSHFIWEVQWQWLYILYRDTSREHKRSRKHLDHIYIFFPICRFHFPKTAETAILHNFCLPCKETISEGKIIPSLQGCTQTMLLIIDGVLYTCSLPASAF